MRIGSVAKFAAVLVVTVLSISIIVGLPVPAVNLLHWPFTGAAPINEYCMVTLTSYATAPVESWTVMFTVFRQFTPVVSNPCALIAANSVALSANSAACARK